MDRKNPAYVYLLEVTDIVKYYVKEKNEPILGYRLNGVGLISIIIYIRYLSITFSVF